MPDSLQRIKNIRILADREKITAQNIIQSGKAITTSKDGVNIKIFAVQSAAGKDGIYNCIEQKLLNDEWADTDGDPKFEDKYAVSVEVLNLDESDPESDYIPALAKYDLIAAWQMSDDVLENRWIGIPCISSVRLAIAKEDAPLESSITCNMILRNGAEAAEGELGYNIEVYGRFFGDADNIASCVPHIFNGNTIHICYLEGKWYCEWFLNSFIDCAIP